MLPNNSQGYGFGDFALYPKNRLLTRFNKAIDLPTKDFEILTYLVEHAGALVFDRELGNAVWGENNQISQGNITNHISKVRKMLGCDRGKPRFIETYHGKRAYRFIAKVSKIEEPIDGAIEQFQRPHEFIVESHLFAPVYLGQGAYNKIRGFDRETSWATYKEFKIESGRLCIFATGVGVWHLTEKHQFNSFTAVALWRRETYEKILSGKHKIRLYSENLKLPLIAQSTDIFSPVFGKIGYVFSVLALEELKLGRPETLRKALQLLSCLRPLEKSTPHSIVTQENLERHLLDDQFSGWDTLEFGMPQIDLGFASWGGLSYLQRTGGSTQTKTDMIEFEIAVQATWWLSKCLYDVCLANGPKVKQEIEALIQQLKWQYATLQVIVPTESIAQRSMIEAILTTSRLPRLIEDTIKLYGQL